MMIDQRMQRETRKRYSCVLPGWTRSGFKVLSCAAMGSIFCGERPAMAHFRLVG